MKIVLDVENMTCGGCKKAVTNAILSADPAADIVVDLETRTVETDTSTPPAALVALLAEAGYDARIAEQRPA